MNVECTFSFSTVQLYRMFANILASCQYTASAEAVVTFTKCSTPGTTAFLPVKVFATDANSHFNVLNPAQRFR